MIDIESMANFLSEEELELIKSHPYKPLIEKIIHLSGLAMQPYKKTLDKFSAEISKIDKNISNSKIKGLYYNELKNRYIGKRTINGKSFFICELKNKDAAEKKMIDFCEKKGINPYIK